MIRFNLKNGSVVGGLLGTLLVGNLTSYYVLSRWCQVTDGPSGGGLFSS